MGLSIYLLIFRGRRFFEDYRSYFLGRGYVQCILTLEPFLDDEAHEVVGLIDFF